MWYAIIAGVFLAVGIGLMIWALRERAKRHEAERAADKAELQRKEAAAVAAENVLKAQELEAERRRLEAQVAAVRERLSAAWEIMAKTADPEVVKEWLDKELEPEEV